MAAAAGKGHLIPAAAGGGIDDPASDGIVHGHEGVNGILVPEDVLDALQVAEALLADVGAEDDVALGVQPVLHHGLRHGHDLGHGVGVVIDAGAVVAAALLPDGNVCFHGKHRVRVGGQHDGGASAGTGPPAQHVPDLIHMDVQQPRLPEQLQDVFRFFLLLMGWRRDLTQGQRFLRGGFVQRFDLIQRFAHSFVMQQHVIPSFSCMHDIRIRRRRQVKSLKNETHSPLGRASS